MTASPEKRLSTPCAVSQAAALSVPGAGVAGVPILVFLGTSGAKPGGDHEILCR